MLVRILTESNSVEQDQDALYIEGRFIVGYAPMGLTDNQLHVVKGMIRHAVEEGKRIRSKEFKDLLG